MDNLRLKGSVIKLRERGKTYSEIQRILRTKIAKSTLSYWCQNIPLPMGYQRKVKEYNKFNLNKARKIAFTANREKREKYLKSVIRRNAHLRGILENRDIAKVALTMLYLGEGSKTQRGSLMFGSSDPFIISLFLHLLRYCYNIDESKFRCTLQCRADQNIKKLEKFWSKITNIVPAQFYKARIDSRTIGKPSRKQDYKGVCRIDYFSADVFTELLQIPKIIYNGPVAQWQSTKMAS